MPLLLQKSISRLLLPKEATDPNRPGFLFPEVEPDMQGDWHPPGYEQPEVESDDRTLEEKLDAAEGDAPALRKLLAEAEAWEALKYPGGTLYRTGDAVIDVSGEASVSYHDDPAEFVSSCNVDEFYPNYEDDFNRQFWESPYELYHATDESNLESIMTKGLNTANKTRGLSNRGVWSAVFTTESLESAATGDYGDAILAIDMGAIPAKDRPYIAREPDVFEAEMREALASALDIEGYYYEREGGMDADTVIVYGSIPPEFLRVEQGEYEPPAKTASRLLEPKTAARSKYRNAPPPPDPQTQTEAFKAWFSGSKVAAPEQVNWRSILTELFADLEPGLDQPVVKIVNQPGKSWLGQCVWKYGQQQNGEPYADLTTTIELQKAIMGDEQTVRRVLAHELCHHEDNLVNNWPLLEEKGFMLFRMMMRNDGTKGHGPTWKAIAARFNAKYGPDFVTPKSDETYVRDDAAVTKPFFVLMYRYVNGDLHWKHATRLSPKMEKALAGHAGDLGKEGRYQHKLFKVNDPMYMRSPVIGAVGNALARNETQKEQVEKLWAEGEDLLPHYSVQKVAAPRSKYRTYTPPDPQTATPAFKSWFAGSKVADADGNPIVVHHGMPDMRWLEEDGEFTTEKERWSGEDDPGRAFFFAADRDVAESYADDRRAFDYQEAEPGVASFYLSLKNPLIVDNKGQRWKGTDNTVARAKKGGHDGVIINNTIDHYNPQSHSKTTTVYVAFHSNQIKAVKGNSGTFDPENKSVYARQSRLLGPKNADNARRDKDPQAAAWIEAARKRPDAEELFVHGSRKLFSQFTQPNLSIGQLIFFSKLTDPRFSRGVLQAEYYGDNLYLCKLAPGTPFNPNRDPEAKKILIEALGCEYKYVPGEPTKGVWDFKNKVEWGRLDYQDTYLVVPPAVEAGYNRFRVYEMSVRTDSHAVTNPDMVEIVDVLPMHMAHAASTDFDKTRHPEVELPDGSIAYIVGEESERNAVYVVDGKGENKRRVRRDRLDFTKDNEGISRDLVKQLYAATSPKPIGTVGDFLIDEKLRKQFAAILWVPVWAYPGLAKHKGALGIAFNGGPKHIYIQLDGGATNQIFYHEMVHADRIAKGRSTLKAERSKVEDTAEKGQEYYANREGVEFEKPTRRQAATTPVAKAADITDNQKFKAWFSGSKITDAQGRPMKMYHGTKAAFAEFDESKFGITDEGWMGKGFYFTYNPEEASGYALGEMFGKGDSPNVVPVYLSIKNPLLITMSVLPDGRTLKDLHEGTIVSDRGSKAVRSLADTGGHDGIVLANKEGKPLHVVAFRPNQIKSAIGNSGAFDPESTSITAALPPVEKDTEWATQGLERARKWVAEEAESGPVSDEQLARLISAAFNKLISVEFVGDPAEQEGTVVRFRVSGSYNALGKAGESNIILKVSPGIGRYLGESAARNSGWWPLFAEKSTAILVHEKTHALQFNRWQTNQRKKDPTGKSYEESLERFQYQSPKSEQQSAYGDVTKYLGNQVEIAAFAREAVQELRHSGMGDREVYIWIRRRGNWDILAQKSKSFQTYYRVYLFNPSVGAPIFRKFLVNMDRALSKEDTAPITKENLDLDKEFNGPATFSEKPNRWSLEHRKGEKPAKSAANAGSEAPKWMHDHFKRHGINQELVPSAWESIQNNRQETAEDNLKIAREKGFEVTPDDKLVLYHGTRSGNAIRRSGYLRPASFLSAVEATASRYAGQAQGKGKIEVLRLEVYPGYGVLNGNGYFTTREPVPVTNVEKVASGKAYNFATSSADPGTKDDILAMVNQATEVSRNTWLSNCNGAEEFSRDILPAPHTRGPSPTFHRSIFRGQPCYYVKVAGTEYVWVKGNMQAAKTASGNSIDPSEEDQYVYHRGRDPRTTNDIVLAADDRESITSYGKNEYAIPVSALAPMPDWIQDYADKYYADEAESRGESPDNYLPPKADPDAIVNSADVWDDPQFVQQIWQDNEDAFLNLLARGVYGFKTQDGAVLFPNEAIPYKLNPVTSEEHTQGVKTASGTLRAYHGTRAGEFDAFRPNYRKGEQLGFGIHFAADKDLALRYALDENTSRKGKQPMLYTVDLTINRLLKADQIVREGSPEFDLAKKLAGPRFMTTKDENGVRCAWMQNAIDASSGQRAERLIREAGYDGIEYEAAIISAAAPGRYNKHAAGTSYVVFEPGQVKIVEKESPTEQTTKQASGNMTAAKILQIIESNTDSKYRYWGIRSLPSKAKAVIPGQPLASSYRWDDGEITDEELDGVATIGLGNLDYDDITIETIEAAFAAAYRYHEERFVLVAGDNAKDGEDPGESVISEPYAVAVWRGELGEDEPNAAVGRQAASKMVRVAGRFPNQSFDWDPVKASKNKKKYHISFNEAQTVFDDPHVYIAPDELHSEDEQRLVAIGYSSRDRMLMVVHTDRVLENSKLVFRIISARPATPQERELYEENA
jgi:uncharacterized DUF497 family protein